MSTKRRKIKIQINNSILNITNCALFVYICQQMDLFFFLFYLFKVFSFHPFLNLPFKYRFWYVFFFSICRLKKSDLNSYVDWKKYIYITHYIDCVWSDFIRQCYNDHQTCVAREHRSVNRCVWRGKRVYVCTRIYLFVRVYLRCIFTVCDFSHMLLL